MRKQRKADLLLVLITAFWGGSYYLTDLCMRQGMTPMGLNAFRFLSAFFVLAAALFRKMRRINAATARYCLLVGLALTGCYVFYAYAITRTSLSNAGFICALPVVFTPLLDFLFRGTRLKRKMLIAVALCTFGLGLLTLNDSFRPRSGDLLCLGCALCYAVDLLLTDKAVHDPAVDPLALGVGKVGVVGVFTLVLSLLMETPRLPQSPTVWIAALFLGVVCSGIAFVIQSVQQQYTTAGHVGLIFTLEPVFAAIVAFLAGERLRPLGYVGAAVMLASLVLMEIDWPGRKKE